jgi:hypothetical protein
MLKKSPMLKRTVLMFSVVAVIIICFSFAAQLVSVEAAPPKQIIADALVSDGNEPCQPQPCCYDPWITDAVKRGNCGQACTSCFSPQTCDFSTGKCMGDE